MVTVVLCRVVACSLYVSVGNSNCIYSQAFFTNKSLLLSSNAFLLESLTPSQGPRVCVYIYIVTVEFPLTPSNSCFNTGVV